VIPAIDFDTVTNAGVKESAFGCSMRSLKLEAFGAGRISASWNETGGTLLLQWRTNRDGATTVY